MGQLIEGFIVNILSTLLYEKISVWKDKRAVEAYVNRAEEWVHSFILGHDETIITTEVFHTFITNHHIVQKLISSVLSPTFGSSSEIVLIDEVCSDFFAYYKRKAGNDLNVNDRKIIKSFVDGILGLTKNFILEQVHPNDIAIIYAIFQVRAEQKQDLAELRAKLELTDEQINDLLCSIRNLWVQMQSLITVFEPTSTWFGEQNRIAISDLGQRHMPEANIDVPIQGALTGIAKDADSKARFIEAADNALIPVGQLRIAELASSLDEITNFFMNINFSNDISIDQIKNMFSHIIDILDKLYDLELKSVEEKKKDSYKLYQIGQAIGKVNDYLEYLDSTEVLSHNNPFILVKGDGGTGKSHLIGDFVNNREKQNKPSILVLGQQLATRDNPWNQILKGLNLDITPDQFLSSINQYGKQNNTRVLLFIDAINEGSGLFVWREFLAGFIERIRKYSWVGLVVTIRTQYMDPIFEDNKGILHQFNIVTHTGFETVENEAILKYCNLYNISLVNIPINREMTNPLFLRLMCEGYRNHTIDANDISSIKIYSNYIASINRHVARKLDYHPSINAVHEAVVRLVEFKCKTNITNSLVSLSDGVRIIVSVQRDYGINGNFIDCLFSEGVITKIVGYDKNEYIYVTYQKLAEYLTAEMIVSREMYDLNILRIDSGIVEALSQLVPYHKSIELFELFPCLSESTQCIESYIEGLYWRSDKNMNTDKVIEFLNAHAMKYEHTQYVFWNVVFALAPKVDSPFNAYSLHSNLMHLAMSERDGIFIPLFSQMYYSEDSSVHRLLYWLLNNRRLSSSADVIKLTAIAVSWLMISPNNRLRDSATRALLNLMLNHIDIMVDILDTFGLVDDPYVKERIYAVAYGCCLSCTNLSELTKIALFVYSDIFDKEETYLNILVRDYAKSIIDWAIYNGANLNIDLTKILPPYKSVFPQIPSDKKIESYYIDSDSPGFKDYQWPQNSILHSMQVEYSRDGKPGGYGDFGRYTFQSYFYRWRNLSPNDLMNIALEKIFDKYKYNPEKHGRYDRSLRNYSRMENSSERIGKKYQWLALYELAAQVSDNYKMEAPWSWKGEEFINVSGSFEPDIRNIDPSIVSLRPHHFSNGVALKKRDYTSFDIPNLDWLKSFDPPSYESLIMYNNWCLLNGSYTWREEKRFGKDKYESPRKELWISISSILVHDCDYERIVSKLSKVNLFQTRIEHEIHNSTLYNKEYYWSPAYNFISRDYYGSEWSRFDDRVFGENLSFLNTTRQYSLEHQKDYSISDGVRFLKPCSEIFYDLGLKYGDGNSLLYDNDNNIVCFDSSEMVNDEIGFFIDYQKLTSFLERKGYRLIWILYGRKLIMQSSLTKWDHQYNQLDMYGIGYMDNGLKIANTILSD